MIYDGAIKCFASYGSNPQDGAKIKYIDFFDENGKRIKVWPFGTSATALKKAIKYQPELLELIEKSELSHEETIKFILQKYETEYILK
ncbi:MAG: hypothetical protein HC854_02250 [Flavobacterium sp.]|nr:hypothetical protein [Flavobacterium sp.]